MSTVDDEILTLYRLSLAEFTPARQALLKRLTKANDPRASDVKALRKPTPSAWAVNQLFVREPAAMAAMVGAGARSLAEGGPAVRAALERVRDETARLAGLAGGWTPAPGSGFVERLQQNLESLALDPTQAEVVARGWLDVDLAPPSFEFLAALQLAAEAGRPAGPRTAAESPPPSRAGEAREERERQARIEQARAALGRAEAQAAEDRQAAGEAAQAADRARFEAARVAKQADLARQAAIDAQRKADAAAAEVERARDALRRLERD